MLTAVASASLRRVAVSLPLRLLTKPLVARPALSAVRAQPFSSTPRVGAAAATKKKAPVKKKPAAKKKKPAAKKPAPRKKKVLTPEEKEKAQIRELKKQALLKEPSRLPDSAWLVYVSQEMKGTAVGNDLASATKAVSGKFKALSTGEHERLQTMADANRASNAEKYKLWVESHTPEQIYNANLARARLARKGAKGKTHRKIADERLPRRPASAYSLYVKERWATGNFNGTVGESSAEIARDWKGLSEGEKKRYHEQADRESAEYSQRRDAILGRNA